MRNDKKLLSINEERTHGTQIQTAASHSLEILRVVQDFVTKNQRSQILLAEVFYEHENLSLISEF